MKNAGHCGIDRWSKFCAHQLCYSFRAAHQYHSLHSYWSHYINPSWKTHHVSLSSHGKSSSHESKKSVIPIMKSEIPPCLGWFSIRFSLHVLVIFQHPIGDPHSSPCRAAHGPQDLLHVGGRTPLIEGTGPVVLLLSVMQKNIFKRVMQPEIQVWTAANLGFFG